ncbi:hypothetical protein L9F63_009150, partial [Diploptera punctata]
VSWATDTTNQTNCAFYTNFLYRIYLILYSIFMFNPVFFLKVNYAEGNGKFSLMCGDTNSSNFHWESHEEVTMTTPIKLLETKFSIY